MYEWTDRWRPTITCRFYQQEVTGLKEINFEANWVKHVLSSSEQLDCCCKSNHNQTESVIWSMCHVTRGLLFLPYIFRTRTEVFHIVDANNAWLPALYFYSNSLEPIKNLDMVECEPIQVLFTHKIHVIVIHMMSWLSQISACRSKKSWRSMVSKLTQWKELMRMQKMPR